MTFHKTFAPPGTRWIMSRRDLPAARDLARYEWMDGDKARHAVLSKRNRQVLDALRQGPVYCASPVRLSDKVLILKRDYGLDIETIRIDGDEEGRFGVYRLVSAVRLVRDATKKAEAA